MPVTSASTASAARGLFCVLVSWLVTAGACPIHLHLPFWKALENQEEVSEKVGQACLAPVSPWTSDSEAEGLTCVGFRGPVLTLKGANPGLVMARGLSHPFAPGRP